MAATIKPIEAKSVHQIQSGQVIVDLCSVVKELVENALDADATSIEVRFKNHGLDAVEVQDNGSGIAESNYENLALKHYTSKLSSYDDLTTLSTFGFRGEALSSLCALSTLSVITAQAHEAPKGKKLEFEISGRLSSTSLVATTKGTTVFVENIFAKLPVRQKELAKNIKREYGKVIGLLQAYACVSTNVRFTIRHALPKAKSAVVFSTKGNTTTRENIANVYGAKVLPQLIGLDLKLDFRSSHAYSAEDVDTNTTVEVRGHISRPVFGEGRQTPDRQLFYVNGRPCGLPQLAKAFNEVYKSYNVSQSPFIFADFIMDTNSYDVNVSPDKRTIFLHDASILTDRLKEELTARFDATEQTVPQTQIAAKKLPAFKQLSVSRELSRESNASNESASRQAGSSTGSDDGNRNADEEDEEPSQDSSPRNLLKAHFGNIASTREVPNNTRKPKDPEKAQKAMEKQAEKIAGAVANHEKLTAQINDFADPADVQISVSQNEDVEEEEHETTLNPMQIRVRDFNDRVREAQDMRSEKKGIVPSAANQANDRNQIPAPSLQDETGIVPNAFARMRPRRPSPGIATITIGDRVVTRVLGSSQSQNQKSTVHATQSTLSRFSESLHKFNENNTEEAGEDSIDEAIEQESDAADAELENTQEVVTDDDESPLFIDQNAEDDLTDQHTASLQYNRGKRNNGSGEGFSNTQLDEIQNTRDAKVQAADRTQEEYRVAELIRMAETNNYTASKKRQKRNNQALRSDSKSGVVSTVAVLDMSLDDLSLQASHIARLANHESKDSVLTRADSIHANEEDRLSLTIAKSDFEEMHIAGQFNLGFIIAVRHKDEADAARQRDEIFIIDQHASDEKYNFERLQAETVVGNQRLVHPIILELTAVEEEVVLENESALKQNGFIIDTDTTGYSPVGDRCRLLTLPTSKELTFNTKDLEELIHLLSESHISANSNYVPRPTKVRKMFAMRACRSSIMIGRTLSHRQMRGILNHMGKLDKPWNCPHGRPTMRHLISLDQLDAHLWKEGDGLISEGAKTPMMSKTDVWDTFLSST